MPPEAAFPPPFAGFKRPLLFAHRGASAQAPENTFDAFDLAHRLGAQVLEMDVHLSADGEVMVFHDATLDRTTDGSGPLAAHTCASLQQLDAGCKFTTRSGAHVFAGREVRIPRLQDLVEAFPNCGFNIEIKTAQPGLIEKVLKILEPLPPQQVVLAAEHHPIMQALEATFEQGSPYALGLSREQVESIFKRSLLNQAPTHLAHRALQVPPRHLCFPLASRRMVNLAHRAQLDVHVWVVNDPPQAQRLLQRGVDGLMTDDPGALLPIFETFRRDTVSPKSP
jgi:glycerophosphoryl diester phosphodiesterase